PVAGTNPIAIATEQDSPCAIAVDRHGVTWATYRPLGEGNLLRTPLEGGVPAAIASHVDLANGLTVAGARTYWTNASIGTLMRVDVEGGAATLVASDEMGIGSVVSGSGAIFWATATKLYRGLLPNDQDQSVVWEGDRIAAIATNDDTVVWITFSGVVM